MQSSGMAGRGGHKRGGSSGFWKLAGMDMALDVFMQVSVSCCLSIAPDCLVNCLAWCHTWKGIEPGPASCKGAVQHGLSLQALMWVLAGAGNVNAVCFVEVCEIV